tara:strand:+ start:150 stop:1337 length:1188 start_codon:yes stop_codon:yes gene_type:complete
VKKKTAYVFLNDKTNSFDIFFPLAKKLKKTEKKLFFKFYVFNKKTHNDIKNNLLFKSEIPKLGEINIMSGKVFSEVKLIRLLYTFYNIIKITFFSLTTKSAFFHFKALEKFPFNFLYSINRNNCYLVDGDPWGYSENINNAINIRNNKKVNVQHKPLHKNYSKLITFSKYWNQVNYSKKINKPIYFLKSTRAEKDWLDFCKAKTKSFLDKNRTLKNEIKGTKVILYLFGTFTDIVTVDQSYNGYKLFLKTMEVLTEINNITIIIKPHPNVDLNYLYYLVSKLNNKKIIINFMHISVLSNICKFAISNYMSLAMGDAWLSGLTTIEFTKYSDKLLEYTNNNSTIPQFADYFLNIDETKKLKDILNRQTKVEKRKYKNAIPKNDYIIFANDFLKSFN